MTPHEQNHNSQLKRDARSSTPDPRSYGARGHPHATTSDATNTTLANSRDKSIMTNNTITGRASNEQNLLHAHTKNAAVRFLTTTIAANCRSRKRATTARQTYATAAACSRATAHPGTQPTNTKAAAGLSQALCLQRFFQKSDRGTAAADPPKVQPHTLSDPPLHARATTPKPHNSPLRPTPPGPSLPRSSACQTNANHAPPLTLRCRARTLHGLYRFFAALSDATSEFPLLDELRKNQNGRTRRVRHKPTSNRPRARSAPRGIGKLLHGRIAPNSPRANVSPRPPRPPEPDASCNPLCQSPYLLCARLQIHRASTPSKPDPAALEVPSKASDRTPYSHPPPKRLNLRTPRSPTGDTHPS